MEGQIFPVDVTLVWDSENDDCQRAEAILKESGFNVRVRNAKDSDFDGPRLHNGRHAVIGVEAIFVFARRHKPNFWG